MLATGRAWFQLDAAGWIMATDVTAEVLFGLPSRRLVGRSIATLLPQLEGRTLIHGSHLDPRLAHECHVGRRFQAVHGSGHHFAVELFFNCLAPRGQLRISLLVCRASGLYPASDANGEEVVRVGQ